MKRTLALSLVLAMIVCTGCGDSHDSLAAESLSTMKDMVSTLQGVKDEASANSAKPKLQSLMAKMKDIQTRQAKLPPPTEDQLKSMESKYSKEIEEVGSKLQTEMARIMLDPKIEAVLADIELTKTK